MTVNNIEVMVVECNMTLAKTEFLSLLTKIFFFYYY